MKPTRQQLLADYNAGMDQKEIGWKYGMDQSLVSYHLRHTPGYVPRRKWNQDREAQAVQLYQDGHSILEVSRLIQTNARTVRTAVRKAGLQIRPREEYSQADRNPSWRGGRIRVGRYWYIHLPSHPHATKAGYFAEHRLVMENSLGRRLHPKEVVHHKDGDPGNNAPSNLELFQSNADHLRSELAGRVPKWSEDGRRRISEGVRKPRRGSRTQSRSKSGASPSPESSGR